MKDDTAPAPSSLVLSLAERVAHQVDALKRIQWPKGQERTLHELVAEAVEVCTTEPIEYRGYHIKPISHASQPFWTEGRWHTRGFIAVKDGCHALPAAVWFYTVDETKHGIDCYIEAGGDAKRFWALVRKAA